jgi:hypothetical protein
MSGTTQTVLISIYTRKLQQIRITYTLIDEYTQQVGIFQDLRSLYLNTDRLCGLVVEVPGYSYRGSGSIPGATRFFLKSSVSGTGSTQPRDDN